MAQNQTILITGAGKRLGAAFALGLARADRTLILHANKSAADALVVAKKIGAQGFSAHAVTQDLAHDDAASSLMAKIDGLGVGPVTALINNASIFDYDEPLAPKNDVFTQSQKVNLALPMTLAAALAAALAAGLPRQQGAAITPVIINILDQKLWNLNPDFYSYTSAKAGLHAATEMMAQAFLGRARACAIAPGLLFPSFGQAQEDHDKVASANLLGRAINIADVVAAADFILDNAGFNGQTIHVDGGQRLLPQTRDVIFSFPTQIGQ